MVRERIHHERTPMELRIETAELRVKQSLLPVTDKELISSALRLAKSVTRSMTVFRYYNVTHRDRGDSSYQCLECGGAASQMVDVLHAPYCSIAYLTEGKRDGLTEQQKRKVESK